MYCSQLLSLRGCKQTKCLQQPLLGSIMGAVCCCKLCSSSFLLCAGCVFFRISACLGEERSRRDCLRRYPSWSFTSFLDSCSHASLCLWIISCHKSPSAKGTPRFRGSGGSSSGTSLRYQTNTVNNLNQYTQRTVPEATVSPH